MAQVQGHPITPCLKEAMVYLSQSELYTQAPPLLELLSGPVQSQATFWRLAPDCGSALEALLQEEELPQQPLEADSVVYCRADGSLLFTDDGWQEVKLGRLFIESTGRQQPLSRPFIEKSQYVAHLGQHPDFARKLDGLIQGYAHLGADLICMSDGAIWLKHYWQQHLPRATLIVDFWHVVEKLAQLARQCIASESARQFWLQQQKERLKESHLEQRKVHLEALPDSSETAKESLRLVLQYLANNAFRMDYKTYLQPGLRIGSAAMEAAHRSVVQSRMKRSGQRWSDRGAQNLLNLPVTYKSGKAKLIRQIITGIAA